MRLRIIVAVIAGITCMPAGAGAQDLPCRGDQGCPGTYPLRIAPAVVPGVPLVWSATAGRLVPPPPGREPIEFGRTIPLGEIVGRRIPPLVRPPAPVLYNEPNLDEATSLTLMSLEPPRRPIVLRRAD